MYRQIKDFYADLSRKGKELNQIELVAGIVDRRLECYMELSGPQ